METIYLAGGCLWGVQAFVKTIPSVVMTEAGRANGDSATLDGPYDGYVECVKTIFDPSKIDVTRLIDDLFEIIDPYSLNQQGEDFGPKYRTGIYSEQSHHLIEARQYIQNRADAEYIMVEVAPLTNYIPSADVHQDHLDKYPNDYCHIPDVLMRKYR
ncbi:TPA: peptide-methionine (S)-S-oxide reductase [Staphylococcus pseudintermedius]|uniref:peptide-methionine (S)-S-oxide reductase n=1 Tax=Staphylococcus pseudintermedius TaxID=283734 RepID=UPI001120CF12|nr:peptide-methionine (S)-S-oxide reductase [Staphylococcus pseudintermedius]EGQ1747404.1 peptide-methionine (S)-S-oxide reductase [Staphylococcus pseudintermedius]EGQ1769787.1 peptide-methionine (S)-S-oxide reductase [Staphylococcus pseudintermedius]EGQ3051229.1 peptide-methionine (S)-S-oxide reductase [Staphylococcus pseudintermedius]EGQ3168091.1 peptide-methionine (S)-S-oxide reductase [Staphylococcus pseudintermedius]EGQ3296239.1 peptide-methionine (S)-S-oxide reductase [Staphylococcus pse